jgi:hypothetical protein
MFRNNRGIILTTSAVAGLSKGLWSMALITAYSLLYVPEMIATLINGYVLSIIQIFGLPSFPSLT